MIKPHRNHPLWFAFLLHRVSGVVLALFLPVHFYVLALALTDPAGLNGFLSLTENIWVKIAEFGLVFLLAAHMLGGLRLMALEWLPWSDRQKTFAVTAVAGAFAISCSFFLSAVQ